MKHLIIQNDFDEQRKTNIFKIFYNTIKTFS